MTISSRPAARWAPPLVGLALTASVAWAGRADPEPVWPPAWWLDPEGTPREAVVADRAMVATANAHASHAALEALRRGGSAVDAALAAQLVLNVVEPQSSGIGGGCFLLYVPPGARTPVFVDGRERAPAGVSDTMFLDAGGRPLPFTPERITGGRAVGVPGTLAALAHAHERWGRLEWATLFETAEHLARYGFPVSRRLHESLRAQAPRLARFPAARERFLTPEGAARAEGSWLRQPELAETFAQLALEGPRAFYEGAIAADVVAAVSSSPIAPGALTLEDLRDYRPVERPPVRGTYRGVDVYGVGPPSSGGTTTIEILQILEGFELGSMAAGSPEAVHLVLEAGRLAFADRNRYLGDADFVHVPVDSLVSTTFAARRRARIAADRVLPTDAGPAPLPASQETTHLSIRDPEGGLLALTSTLEHDFGSGILVPGRGFFLNNELTDFDAVPVREDGTLSPNRIEPGKRPRSSISPTILMRDGQPLLAVGSPGGSRIIGIVTWVILGVVDWGMDVQEAINFPRALNRGVPAADMELLWFEGGALEVLHGVSGTVDALRELGHVIEPPPKKFRGIGGVHAIRVRADGRIEGGADPRREGVAVGF